MGPPRDKAPPPTPLAFAVQGPGWVLFQKIQVPQPPPPLQDPRFAVFPFPLRGGVSRPQQEESPHFDSSPPGLAGHSRGSTSVPGLWVMETPLLRPWGPLIQHVSRILRGAGPHSALVGPLREGDSWRATSEVWGWGARRAPARIPAGSGWEEWEPGRWGPAWRPQGLRAGEDGGDRCRAWGEGLGAEGKRGTDVPVAVPGAHARACGEPGAYGGSFHGGPGLRCV